MQQTVDDILRENIQKHGGIFLGEAHGQPQTVSYLRNLAPTLKEAGVDTLYVEFINHEDQAFLDELTPDDPDLLPKLKELVQRRSIVAIDALYAQEEYVDPVSTLKEGKKRIARYEKILLESCEIYADIFQAYIKAGIRLVGIEDPDRMVFLDNKKTAALEKGKIKPEEFVDLSLSDNIVSRNESWVRLIREDQEEFPSKFAVLGGLFHSAQGYTLIEQEKVRARITGIIPTENDAVLIGLLEKLPTDRERLLKNSVDFQLGIPTVLFYDTINAAQKEARLLGVDTNHYGKCIKIVTPNIITPNKEPQHVDKKTFIDVLAYDALTKMSFRHAKFSIEYENAIVEALQDWMARTLPETLTNPELTAIKGILQNSSCTEEYLALLEGGLTDLDRGSLLKKLVRETHADFLNHPISSILIDRKQEEDRQRLKHNIGKNTTERNSEHSR